MESITLEDFDVDFGRVKMPEGPVKEGELPNLAKSFFEVIHAWGHR